MCFYSKQSHSAQALENRFKANFKDKDSYQPQVYNAFQFPKTPIITHQQPQSIQLFHWGLIPSWAKNEDIRKYTLNAKLETLNEKPSFSNVINNRCLVLVDAFYEWQWLDPKGKQKQKYEIALPNNEIFAFAGLWNVWIDPSTGERRETYTIITTKANELMSEIHNTKKRMPVIVSRENERAWLYDNALEMGNDRLIAKKV